MGLESPLSCAKESADRIAAANQRYKHDWIRLFSEIISCEVLREELSMIDNVDEDELREQAKSKRSFVAFMTQQNNEFVKYNFYRDYTNLFEKIKDRREDFRNIDLSNTGAVVNYLEQSGFTGFTETTKLLRTAEEVEEANAAAVAKRQAAAIQKRMRQEIASQQLANRKKSKEPREEETPAPRVEEKAPPVEEEAPRVEEEAPREEASRVEKEAPREEASPVEETPKKKRGRPKKQQKPIVCVSETNDFIAELLQNAEQENDVDDDIDDVKGVEETKGNDDDVCAADTTVTLPDDLIVLRSRIEQLESFIIGLGEVPPPPPEIMDTGEAEETIATMSDFKDLHIDPVLSDKEDNNNDSSSDSDSEETSVEVFTHDGVKYYKDTENQLYTFGDLENAELIGQWNEETKCIEVFEDDDEEED